MDIRKAGALSGGARLDEAWPAMFLKSDTTIFDEESFARIVSFERRRTDRSCRPFLLLLLGLSTLPQDRQRQRRILIKNVMQSLEACTRQTDITGWYKTNTTLGVIFTELCQENPAVGKILEKVTAALQACLTPEQFGAITVSAHLYPYQHYGDPGSGAGDWLYPDLKRKKLIRLLKRTIDILGSLGLLILFAPVFVMVGVAVKLTSKGPILFHQTRIGQFGRPFTLLKFRSMYMDADSKMHEKYVTDFILSGRNGAGAPEALKQNGLFKMSQDPRVTPLGHFIRKMSLDEFPQLLHVLSGRMSLVGPRPPMPYEVERYATWHLRRVLEARPGLTGLWQVQGRSRTTFDDMVRLDLKYIDEWSVWADLKILLQTPWVVLKSEGAR
jgi:lipopolysaccharide/colanic/teichoic acid biosynthesis glycosyltransferase